ncbi:MAG TPA: membrane protein insertase YidC [Bdellovibrionota bacterium]|nr:membrane protein insertase YidC [Bdellovibrionota bacterium]
MDNEKRTLLALGLMMAFLYVWFEYFIPKPVRTPTPAATPAPGATIAGTPSAKEAAEAPKRRDGPASSVIPLKEWSAETPLMHLRWTNRPGTPAEILLKKYRTTAAKDAAPVAVVPFRGEAPPPLRWELEIEGQRWSDENASYTEVSRGDAEVTYETSVGPDLFLRKKFSWNPKNYSIEASVEILNRRSQAVKAKAITRLSSRAEEAKGSMLSQPPDNVRVAAFINETSVRVEKKAIPSQPSADLSAWKPLPEGNIDWAGFDSRYFLMALIPVEGRWSEVRLNSDADALRIDMALIYPPREIAPSGSASYRVQFFTGPKDIGVLEASSAASLDRAIDLGDWLGPIARPILFFLRWLHSLLPNYGVAIILLTIVVRLLMFPLAHMQAKSMKKMQQHKPELDAIREKYKDNKEAQARETMNYMRKYKVNPMGGCLLLLPQMPIFFALYRVLYNSIELRHAPFFLWIHDLSAHDPYYVTPVILGVLMVMQQRLTPTPGVDPAQQTMMKIMPVIFSALMLFLPAGLTLYILVSTLWGVAQQYWVQGGWTVAPAPAKT